ncbi:MAG: N-acetylmuramoyl-L-alanine amidase [Actinobacteria bacterium]|nr:N-acetylmuramoyl-L-alanine amidase [Actinomycetota bacterium]
MGVRRRLLRLLMAVVFVAAFLPILASTSYTLTVPETLHSRLALQERAALAPASAAVEPGIRLHSHSSALPFAATHIGIQWRGEEDPPPEFRTSADGKTWTPWKAAVVSEDLSDHDAHLWFSTLEPGNEARFVEVRGTDEMREPKLSAINTKDGSPRRVTVQRSASAATPQPHVISRAEWGANESLRKGSPDFARIRQLVVHHTVTANDDPDPKATIRAIYSYHTQSRGWNDIGYNFLIDSNGNVYEGRFARSYAAGEIPTGEDTRGRGVIGAHASGFNTGSAGVSLLGDFTSVPPRPAAVSALVDFLAWKADRHGIYPFGTHNGAPSIAGHRDVGSTACPGSHLYTQMPQIRNDVEARIQATTSLTPPSMPMAAEIFPKSISKDRTPSATGAVSRSTVRVDVLFKAELFLYDRVISVAPEDGSFTVDDADYNGIPLAEGRYKVSAVSFDAAGRASEAANLHSDYVISLGDNPASGYWIMGSDGGIFTYGNAKFYGSTGAMRLNQPPVGMDATPTGDGYWLVASDGGIFAFGGARFQGSTGNIRLNKPIVDMASTPTGAGYWLVASDGGIFAFGDAGFQGSTGDIALNQPIVGMAPTPTGAGYWLVASDGGIFAFGDARFQGSTGGTRLNQPIVGMATTPTGQGYWLVAADGGIFTFGDAVYHGSVPGRNVKTTVEGIAATFSGKGYYALSTAGSIYAFGDAPNYGSVTQQGIRTTTRDLALLR